MLSMMDRIKIEDKVIPEAAMPITKFYKLHPALHQACCTFTTYTNDTESLILHAKEMIAILKGKEIPQYLETLVKLYSASEELEQVTALLRLQQDMNIKPEEQPIRL